MTIIVTVLATVAGCLLARILCAAKASPAFPRDHCRNCNAPAKSDAERHERSDEHIDRMAQKIHAMNLRRGA